MTSTKDIKMGTSYQNLKEGNGNVYNQSSKLNYFYQVITNLAQTLHTIIAQLFQIKKCHIWWTKYRQKFSYELLRHDS